MTDISTDEIVECPECGHTLAVCRCDESRELPLEGRTYRHVKGGEYVVMALVTNQTTGMTDVLYRDADGGLHTRDLNDWMRVQPDGAPRFERVPSPKAELRPFSDRLRDAAWALDQLSRLTVSLYEPIARGATMNAGEVTVTIDLTHGDEPVSADTAQKLLDWVQGDEMQADLRSFALSLDLVKAADG